jgi:hypothetical protein
MHGSPQDFNPARPKCLQKKSKKARKMKYKFEKAPCPLPSPMHYLQSDNSVVQVSNHSFCVHDIKGDSCGIYSELCTNVFEQSKCMPFITRMRGQKHYPYQNVRLDHVYFYPLTSLSQNKLPINPKVRYCWATTI